MPGGRVAEIAVNLAIHATTGAVIHAYPKHQRSLACYSLAYVMRGVWFYHLQRESMNEVEFGIADFHAVATGARASFACLLRHIGYAGVLAPAV